MLADLGRRGAARLWYAKTLAAGGAVPYARDAPRVRSGDGPTDHVLLVGNGPAHGWGVSSHRLALCGQLADALAERTGRTADVEFVGAELMSMRSALSWLGDLDLAPFDAVVVVMGMNDAVRLTPVRSWEEDLTSLLEHLRGGLRHEAPVVLSGIQPVGSVPPYEGRFAAAGQRRADELNLATRRIVARTPGAAFVPLAAPELEPGRPYGSVTTYRAWADVLAEAVRPLLDSRRAVASDRRRSRVEARPWRWAGTAVALDAAADRGTPELRRLTRAAKIELRATLAVVTLLEGDRMWFAAASADTPLSIPLALSYDRHVQPGTPLVVGDATRDPRFRDNPFIAQSHLPFYAGHPVHDLAGRMIGTFCVLGAQPRPAALLPLPVLASYASLVELELHRLESEAVGAVTR